MNGWNDNRDCEPTDDDIDYDYLRELGETDRHEFNEAMMAHVRESGDKVCADPKCVYCATYGQLMADLNRADADVERYDYDEANYRLQRDSAVDEGIPF